MTPDPAAVDAEKFFEIAVREKMLTTRAAKELRREARHSGTPPGVACVDAGRLTPIQAEAIEGLASEESIAPGYEVVGLLGYGGIGVVYRARQPALDRIIALKTISAERLGATTAPARFQQEARAIAKLKHPNIVTAYDYGSSGGRFYFAMELVEGVDLDSYIKHSGTLTEKIVWHLVHQVASALAHAHEAGIVHRDIKPANLLLTDPPAGYPLPTGVSLIKVTDFGLVQLRAGKPSDESTRLTVSGATMGTPNYMAPEQIDDAHVDHRADVYALGATAFHMLTGRPPYAGQSLMKVITSKLTGDTEPLESLPQEVTRPTRELLAAMMAHDPADRPQEYQDLLERVGEVIEEGLDSRVVLRTTRIMSGLSSTSSQQDAETILSLERLMSDQRTRRHWLLGGVAAIAATAAGVGLWNRPRSLPTPRFGGRHHEQGLLNTKELAVPEWRGSDGFFGVVQPDGGGIDGVQFDSKFASRLWFKGSIKRRLHGSPEWRAMVKFWYESRLKAAPDEPIDPFRHFGVAVRLALGATESLELMPFWEREGDPPRLATDAVLRLEADHVRLGRRSTDRLGVKSAFADYPTQLAPNDEVTIRLERDATHWFAYWDRGDEPIGATPVGETELPSGLLFHTPVGSAAVLSEVYLYALAPRAPAG